MAEKGWIKLHRKLQDCWIWQINKPFDERSAWIDLLLSANHSDVKIHFNGELILIKRGQFITSVRNLSAKWKWNKDKTLKFLRLLEKDKMIKRESDNFRTLVTIENYEVYQCCIDAERTEQGTEQGTQDGHEPATNKNDKNDKEEKNNNTCAFPEEKHDTLEQFFESIWKLYPIKKGKGQVSKTKKKVLQRIGYEEIARCIARFEEDKKDIDRKYWMHGSTFFNSGYVDYLDTNFCRTDEPKEVVQEEEPAIDLWSD